MAFSLKLQVLPTQWSDRIVLQLLVLFCRGDQVSRKGESELRLTHLAEAIVYSTWASDFSSLQEPEMRLIIVEVKRRSSLRYMWNAVGSQYQTLTAVPPHLTACYAPAFLQTNQKFHCVVQNQTHLKYVEPLQERQATPRRYVEKAVETLLQGFSR